MLHRLFLVVAVGGCQGKSAEDSPAPERAPVIEARGGAELVARITAGHPCRARVLDVEAVVGVEPLIAAIGEARWTGEDAPNGTTLRKDGEQIARLASADDQYALFDPAGVPLERAFATGDTAKIVNAAGQDLRTAVRAPTGTITVHMSTGPDRLVTGTTDLLLAALLSADETSPEVRALAACHRLATRDANRESDVPARP